MKRFLFSEEIFLSAILVQYQTNTNIFGGIGKVCYTSTNSVINVLYTCISTIKMNFMHLLKLCFKF